MFFIRLNAAEIAAKIIRPANRSYGLSPRNSISYIIGATCEHSLHHVISLPLHLT